MNKIKVRCIVCGGEIYFESGQQLVRCAFCGQTMAVTEFDSELARMNAAIEEGEQAKRALEAAEQEREKAEKRLGQAMSSLDGIFTSQKNTDQALKRIASDFSKEKEAQRDMRDLLAAVRGKADVSHDMLSGLLKTVSEGQQDSKEKLVSLQLISEAILQNQDNMFGVLAILPKITEKMDMNAQEQQKLAGDFMNLFQNLHREDIQRLNAISSASSALLNGQKALEDKTLQLHQAALDTQSKIDGFHQEYRRDKLEKLHTLCRQAEQFQIDKQYDQAAERYLEVEANGGADAETCWRRILCHYCTFYQKNHDKKMIPIVLNPDLTDPEQMSLRKELASRIASAGDEIRRHYENQLAEIDAILDQYRHVRHETEYDVFISVKQTDHLGHYTIDGDKASELYDFLVSRGLKVFNSRRSLPAGEIYEPRIIGAIMSARVMIVVGSSAENMDSDWVKNEWSRFQWLQRREKDSKRKLLCYLTGGMNPYSIPRGLNPDRQAIIDGISAHEALMNALKDLIKTQNHTADSPISTSPPETADTVLNKMMVWLLTGDYQQVTNKYESLKAAGLYLDQPKLHLYALCAEKKVHEIEKIAELPSRLKEEPLFKLALATCKSDVERGRLEDYAVRNERHLENQTAEAEEWFRKGEETEQQGNDFLAFSYYQKAASMGHLKAQRYLGCSYRYGSGTKKDNVQAEYWFRKAAEKGDADAQNHLAHILEDRDDPEAAKWLALAAEQGINSAQYDLACWYHLGIFVEKDEELCVYWRERAASYIDPSYDENDGFDLYGSRHALAEDYLTGNNIKKDEQRAVDWFRKIAEDDDAENSWRDTAQYKLGKCYEEGIGVRKDSGKAIEWYKKAVSRATDYDRESGIDQKARERLKALQAEAEKKTSQTQKTLSAEEWYQKGLSEDEKGNQTEAFDCHLKAAQEGHAKAQNELGVRYENGIGTAKDTDAAFKWYNKAAESGNRAAQCNLGLCYEYGRGVKKNMEEAVKWYQKAADKGSTRGQYRVAACYERGNGISKDLEKAIEWYGKAAANKYKDASKKVEELEDKASREKRGSELTRKYGKNDGDYAVFLEAMKSITEFSCLPLGVLLGSYSHAQMDILEQAVEKVRKEKSLSPETRKRLQEIEKLKLEYPGAVIPDENTEIISRGKGVLGKVLVIPYWVREVGKSGISTNNFFPGNNSLEEVYILSDNCVIKPDAFTRCSNLKKVVISASPMLKITDSFYHWNGREDASVSEKGYYIKKVADRITVDFKGRTDFSKINDALLRYKAGLCIKCGGEFGFLGKCRKCGEKRIK